MCNRSEIVTNGCSGNCCEKFTLPVTLEDLHMMKAEWDRVNRSRAKLSIEERRKIIEAYENSAGYEAPKDFFVQPLTCSNGFERRPVGEEELDKLIDMLIYLGEDEICPQYGVSFNEKYEYDSEKHTAKLVHDWTHGHMSIKDKKLVAQTFTCKYFDKQNRICTNYQNRPDLCRNFGSKCAYKGCGFVSTMQKLKEVESVC